MLKIGEYAVYGINGVCRMIGTTERSGGTYYVFEPVSDESLKIYLPTDSASVRSPAGKEQAVRLIESISDMPDIWVTDSRERRRRFGDILSRCDLSELTQLTKTLYRKKCERRKIGKMMYSYENNQLRSAENAVSNEIAFALGISGSEAEALLEEKFAS